MKKMHSLKTTLSIAVILGLSCFPLTYAQALNCSCSQKPLTTWGPFISGTGRCMGRCDNSVIVRSRTCFVFDSKGRFRDTETCLMVESRNCNTECAGEWSSWGSTGPCTGRCGLGVQLQHRTCYRKNIPGRNIRINECKGGYGAYEQSRNQTCRRFIRCRFKTVRDSTAATRRTTQKLQSTVASTIKKTALNSTTTLPTTAHSTTHPLLTNKFLRSLLTTPVPSDEGSNKIASSSVSLKDSQSIDNESPTDVKNSDQPTHVSPVIFDTVTLAAVLGSVAIVCVTIVAIAFAIVCLKRHDGKMNNAFNLSSTSNSSFVKVGTQAKRSDCNFNAVEFPLPSATSQYGQVSNPLYETTLMNGERIVAAFPKLPAFSQHRRISNNINTNYEMDPIYFSVDDHNR